MEPYPEGDTTIFLYVGRMMREKGVEELLAAAEALHSEKTQFWLLGYPDEQADEKLSARDNLKFWKRSAVKHFIFPAI